MRAAVVLLFRAEGIKRMRDERTRRRIAMLLTVAALALSLFLALAAYVMSRHGEVPVDVRIENFVRAHRTGWLVVMMKAVTWLGSNVVLVPVVLAMAVWFLLRRGDSRSAIELVAALVGSIVFYDIAKAIVHRARPPAVFRVGYNFTGGSFPSGHSTSAMAVWGMLAFLLALRASPYARKELFAGAAVLIVTIGASRIYLGAHWPTDVIGGFALGGAWLAGLVALDLLMRRPHGVRRRGSAPLRLD
jgi:membrane-associated phospholipid phosphatase